MTYNILFLSGVHHSDLILLYIKKWSPAKCSYHPSPYNVFTILLTTFPMVYIPSPWLICFMTRSFVPLNPLHLVHSSPHIPPLEYRPLILNLFCHSCMVHLRHLCIHAPCFLASLYTFHIFTHSQCCDSFGFSGTRCHGGIRSANTSWGT